jgi:hypothetical protein
MMRRGVQVGTKIGKDIAVHSYSFARMVHHPGNKPKPFFFPTVEKHLPLLPGRIKRSIAIHLARSAGRSFLRMFR